MVEDGTDPTKRVGGRASHTGATTRATSAPIASEARTAVPRPARTRTPQTVAAIVPAAAAAVATAEVSTAAAAAAAAVDTSADGEAADMSASAEAPVRFTLCWQTVLSVTPHFRVYTVSHNRFAQTGAQKHTHIKITERKR